MSNKLIVYHGTSSLFETVLLEKSRNNRDFGRGFYTTTMKEQDKAVKYLLEVERYHYE